jgi:hypothetical protein
MTVPGEKLTLMKIGAEAEGQPVQIVEHTFTSYFNVEYPSAQRVNRCVA